MNEPVRATWTADQAAAYLGLSTKTLHAMRRAGTIGYIALTDRVTAYTQAICDEYLASRRRCEQSAATPKARPAQRRHGNVVALPFSERRA